MEQRRLLLFFVSAMAILLVWTNIFAPMFFPPPPRPAGRQVAQQDEAAEDGKANDADGQPEVEPQAERQAGDDGKPADAENEQDQTARDEDDEDQKPAEDDREPPEEKPTQLVDDWDPKQIKHRNVTLGSVDESTGYFMEVDLTSKGAGVLELRLSDPRYVRLDDNKKPLELIASSNRVPPALATAFYTQEEDNAQQQDEIGLADLAGLIEWQIAKDENGQERLVEDPKHPGVFQSVTFRGVFPELGIEVLKTFTLTPSDKQSEDELQEARRTELSGYQLELGVRIRNLTAKKQQVVYHLQGPVGVPIEGRENSRMFKPRQIAFGFLEPGGSVNEDVLPVEDLIDKIDDERSVQWSGALRYIGIDVKYFASLLVPVQNQLKDQIYAAAIPMLVERDNEPKYSDISVVLKSRTFTLLAAGDKFPDGDPGDVISHQIKLYAGPKREELLAEMDADSLLDYGRFGILAGTMLWILNGLHGVGIAYGIAIVLLTLIVRSCLYPLSRKQALGAKKMKELSPKLQEIKKKYAKDKEKQARAQMELFRKHNYNPLAGCLPILLQLPIFFSLYAALNSSVDLRLASFLWIDNLAAPDRLFDLPFKVPITGWTEFNLLPILTIVLFIAQQKLFMPPAQTQEQEMQYKMMKVMMIVMGFIFYTVPAGLCIYFITSSLWGMAERKTLDYGTPAEKEAPATEKKRKSKVKA